MSALDSSVPGNTTGPPAPVKRSRFAGERAGAWLFAASFSVGIWGLALKVLEPSHPHIHMPSVMRYAILVPSAVGDGRATVIWANRAVGETDGYPVIGGVPVIAMTSIDSTSVSGTPATN